MTKPILPTADMPLELIHTETGQRWPIDALMDNQTGKWQKVFSLQLCRMLNLVGDEKTRVVTFLIKRKDYMNFVTVTVREIAEEVKVSTKTVARVMKTLQNHNFIHKVRNGKYQFSPHVMRHGSRNIGAAVITMYDET